MATWRRPHASTRSWTARWTRLGWAVLTWARPRDLSHYETFEHYHATFYQHVEAQSVTPFSPRAMDRGLTGAMLAVMRNRFEPFALAVHSGLACYGPDIVYQFRQAADYVDRILKGEKPENLPVQAPTKNTPNNN